MAFQADHYVGQIHLYPTTFCDQADFIREFHVYYARKLPWLHLADSLHRYPSNARVDADARVSPQKTDYAGSASTELPRVLAMLT